MYKRGQTTVFIIVGIIVIIAVAFIFFTRSVFIEEAQKYYDVPKYLESEIGSLNKEVGECIISEGLVYLDSVRYGGYLNPARTLVYHGDSIGILCQNIPDSDACLNGMFTVSDFEERMDAYLTSKVYACLELGKYRSQDYSVLGLDSNNFNLDVEVGSDNVKIIVDFPVSFSKDSYHVEREKFARVLNVPVGDVLKGVRDILEVEARGEIFSPLVYNMDSYGKYDVENFAKFPHTVYKVSLRDDDYNFWFIVENE